MISASTRRNIVSTLILLLICNTAVFSQAAKPSTAWPPPTLIDGLGVSVHFRGAVDEQSSILQPAPIAFIEQQLDQITNMGLKIVRIDNHWQWLNKDEGTYDFALQHRTFDACQKRGLRLLTILTFFDPRYEKGRSVSTPKGREAYARFCAHMAREFKGKGVIWEMWNEPNVGVFWNPKPSATEYAAAIKMAVIAMREANPDCTIIAPNTSGVDIKYIETCFKHGLLDYIDGVNVHPYGEVPEINFQRYLHLQSLIKRYGGTTPIVNSELGFPQLLPTTANYIARTQQKQAALIIRSILIDFMAGVAIRIIYTNRDYDDKMEWFEATFGLVTHDGKPKAGYHTVKTLTSQLKGM